MKTKTVCKGCSEPFGAGHSINGYCLECVDADVPEPGDLDDDPDQMLNDGDPGEP